MGGQWKGARTQRARRTGLSAFGGQLSAKVKDNATEQRGNEREKKIDATEERERRHSAGVLRCSDGLASLRRK